MALAGSVFAGFALVPSFESMRLIIDFRQANPDITGPVLGTDTNLPHLTLFQGMYQEFNHSEILDGIKRLAEKPVSLKFISITKEPGDWVFANVQDTLQLTYLHFLTAGASKHFMSPPAPAHGMEQWNVAEQDAFNQHGYRYALKAYQPHITLGTGSEVSAAAQRLFANKMLHRYITFEKVVYYHAGERGALAKVIDSVDLR